MGKIKIREAFSADGFFKLLKSVFSSVVDPKPPKRKESIKYSDILMSGFAIFSMKYSSLLQFENRKKTSDHNLEQIYHIDEIPSDTYLRKRLDQLDPEELRPTFKEIHKTFQQEKGFKQYEYYQGHSILALDGTQYFTSKEIHCENCLEKVNKKTGVITYSHQMIGAVLIHPDLKEVIPFMPEPIVKQDGMTKNDCERNGTKRFFEKFRKDNPRKKIIIVEDGLSSNGPHILELKKHNLRFVLGAKPGDHTYLFDYIKDHQEKVIEKKWEENGVSYHYRYCNDVPLNESNKDLRVGFLEYTEVKKGKKYHNSWVTDFVITDVNIMNLIPIGRVRWKVENETFNTLKNHGYHFEHNFGHGEKNLSSVFVMLMMLAFLVDQIQQSSCKLFQAAWKEEKSKKGLWETTRAYFFTLKFTSMTQLYHAIVYGYEIKEFKVFDDTT